MYHIPSSWQVRFTCDWTFDLHVIDTHSPLCPSVCLCVDLWEILYTIITTIKPKDLLERLKLVDFNCSFQSFLQFVANTIKKQQQTWEDESTHTHTPREPPVIVIYGNILSKTSCWNTCLECNLMMQIVFNHNTITWCKLMKVCFLSVVVWSRPPHKIWITDMWFYEGKPSTFK